MFAMLLATATLGLTAQPEAPYDVVIRGGQIIDGTGAAAIAGDVAIRGQRIVAVGNVGDVSARTVVDARGRYVTPGFIDVHLHAGEGLAGDLAHGQPVLAQGITTVVVNPHGGGPVDVAAPRATYEKNGIGPNAAIFVGHGSIRREVLGMADRAPTAAELNRMLALTRTAMEAGAIGLSSGPYYAPGSYAKPTSSSPYRVWRPSIAASTRARSVQKFRPGDLGRWTTPLDSNN
jgi:N-acyl-D-amino-acid deacylase